MRQKVGSHFLLAINKQNNRHTTPPQTRITFIVPRFNGIGSRHKSGIGKNQVRQRTTPRDNRCFNRKDFHPKSNEFSLPVIYFSPPLNTSVINPSQLSLGFQQSHRSSHNTRCDNRWFNSKDSNPKRNYFPSLVIPVPPPLNDSVINTTQLSSGFKKSSRSSHNKTNELQASSILRQTSPDSSNTMPSLSTNNRSCNIYGCMVDMSKFIPAKRQKHAVMLLQHYHELCNMNVPSSMFVSIIRWYEPSFIIWTQSSNHIG